MITALHITSPHSHAHTLDGCVAVANFNVMTLQQAENTEPVPHEHMLLMNNHPKECEHFLSHLFHKQTENDAKQRDSIPETCNDASKLNKIEKQISDEIFTLRDKEQLKPTKTDEQWKELLSKFNWDECLLNENEKTRVEHFLVKHHSVFARHPLDIGINTEFELKLTPQHGKLVYIQSLPTPTNVRDDLFVEIVLMREYGIVTTLPFGKFSSPFFAQRK